MRLGARSQGDPGLNPYIALSDLCITLILILAFFALATNLAGKGVLEKIRYRSMQEQFADRVMQEPSLRRFVHEDRGRNDPPGDQRWVFSGSLFEKTTVMFGREHRQQVALSREGREAVISFARLLNEHRDKWRRIRIEGHSFQRSTVDPDDWMVCAKRAEEVLRVMYRGGRIEPNFLSISGRGSQATLYGHGAEDPENERVEIVLEYAGMAASGRSLRTVASPQSAPMPADHK